MKVFGEGQYNLNVVKETRVTKDFLSLDQSIKECQDVEDNEDCHARMYVQSLVKKCNCLPFGIQQLHKKVDND